MALIEFLEKITTQTSELDLLVALAEEAAELNQAALKLARARKYINHPTPVNQDQAFNNLLEEYTDVQLCAKALGLTLDEDLLSTKAKRWAHRLEEANK